MSEKLIPLVYLAAAGMLAIVCKIYEVPDTTTGMLVGAALTRVRVGAIFKKKPDPKPIEP